MSQELLEILVCPDSRQPVSTAPPDLLDRLNREIEAGTLRTRGGDVVNRPISEGLLREDGSVLYIVDDGIPVMLVEDSIPL